MRHKPDDFNGHKQRSKVCVVYLEFKLHQDRYSCCISKLKPQNGRINVFRVKQATTSVPLIFLDDKMLKEILNAFFRGCKSTRKVQRMYLTFKNLKINCQYGSQSNKMQEITATEAFGV